MDRRRALWSALGLGFLVSCGGEPAPGPGRGLDPAAPPPGVTFDPPLDESRLVAGETIYVPIASSVATADTARPVNLAATLTIRNLDRTRRIEVRSARYHDSGGRPIRDHLDRPIQLAPLASVALFVRESDESGGPSPSFLVNWVADGDVVAPLVEAVMVSTAGAQGIALTSQGRVIAVRKR